MPSFATPEPIEVTVTTTLADVRLCAGDRDDTVVTVAPSDPATADDVTAAQHTRIDHAGGRLTIKTPRRLRRFSPLRDGGAVDVTIELPVGSAVHVEGDVVDLHTTGRLGDCRVTTSTGDLTVDHVGSATLATAGRIVADRIDGDATITSTGRVDVRRIAGSATIGNSNGATHLGHVSGELRCRSANGDVTVEAAGADVEVRTANGDVVVDDLARGEASAETGNGRIEIGVRAGVAALLDVRTRFGRVDNRLTEVEGPEGSDRTVRLRARTSYGDIVIRRPELAGGHLDR